MSLIEGKSSFHTVGSARLIDDSREMAWAETHVHKSDDLRWIVGAYVQASTDEVMHPNENGHVHRLSDLKTAIKSIPHKPLNLLHQAGRRVGTFVAAEFMWPDGKENAADAEPPIIEALAAYWQYFEPELLTAIEMAHNEGQLFYSMEALPKSLICKGKGEFAGCGESFPYKGRTSPTYCDHLNEPRSRKVLVDPHFLAGALIVPPSKPGWRNANIKEISKLVVEHEEAAEAAYNEIAAATPHLESVDHEKLMQWFLLATQGAK